MVFILIPSESAGIRCDQSPVRQLHGGLRRVVHRYGPADLPPIKVHQAEATLSSFTKLSLPSRRVRYDTTLKYHFNLHCLVDIVLSNNGFNRKSLKFLKKAHLPRTLQRLIGSHCVVQANKL